MNNYKDDVDIIMTALTEIGYHVDDEHYSEIKPKVAVAAFSLGQLVSLYAQLETRSDKARYDKLKKELEIANSKCRRLQNCLADTDRQREFWKKEAAKLKEERQNINSSVQHGRKIMKIIGKHK